MTRKLTDGFQASVIERVLAAQVGVENRETNNFGRLEVNSENIGSAGV
jgi:hypothetical protein